MSFDVNIGRSQPIIKAAASMNNDGGSGGNTGYMGGGQRKKDQGKGSLFSKDIEIDSFEMASKLPKNFDDITENKNSWINGLLNKIIK